MKNFAQLLWTDVADFAIDGNATADMNGGEGGVVVCCILGNNLKLIGLVYLQTVRPKFVTLPFSESDESRSADESLRVKLDNLFSSRAGNKPFDQDLRSGIVLI